MRKEVIGNATLYLADCLTVLPTLSTDLSVVSDPPYGMNWDADTTRFSGGNNVDNRGSGRDGGRIVGDDRPFDPAPWLAFKECVLWGANHYAARLPVGTTLVWIKRNPSGFGTFLSDAEVAWTAGGHGVYCYMRPWHGAEKVNRKERRWHPSEKPIDLMAWCVKRTTMTVLDPYMGSGTTGVACHQLGRPFIGIEIVPEHFETACERIDAAQRQERLFA